MSDSFKTKGDILVERQDRRKAKHEHRLARKAARRAAKKATR